MRAHGLAQYLHQLVPACLVARHCSDEEDESSSAASSSASEEGSKAGTVIGGVARVSVGGLKRGRKPGSRNKAAAGVAKGNRVTHVLLYSSP